MSGSAATNSTVKPSGSCIFAIASVGLSGGPGTFDWRRGTKSSAKAGDASKVSQPIKQGRTNKARWQKKKRFSLCLADLIKTSF
jgi:hypothetical protein